MHENLHVLALLDRIAFVRVMNHNFNIFLWPGHSLSWAQLPGVHTLTTVLGDNSPGHINTSPTRLFIVLQIQHVLSMGLDNKYPQKLLIAMNITGGI